jgi:hypothetical protein
LGYGVAFAYLRYEEIKIYVNEEAVGVEPDGPASGWFCGQLGFGLTTPAFCLLFIFACLWWVSFLFFRLTYSREGLGGVF